ncbi:AAA family ATPase [Curtobacterium sp. 'Ferrero']|uniref:AAA family ATPase n=1 Tax=Curtobacterium sp. 'Ferrero' TaxID=2033654 RepID=UPI0020D091B5|nr:AAA family ATPase [Curtobacterium sp. 'Ferrero']
MATVLITGLSGTGKSSALTELASLGHRVVDTDDAGWREYHPAPDPTDPVHQGEWLWVEDRIAELLDTEDDRSLFVSGCVRNQSVFADRFEAVVLFDAPLDTMLDRVAGRTTNPYGKSAVERAMIEADHREVLPLLRASCTHVLDASRPLHDVVADLVAIASFADRGGDGDGGRTGGARP